MKSPQKGWFWFLSRTALGHASFPEKLTCGSKSDNKSVQKYHMELGTSPINASTPLIRFFPCKWKWIPSYSSNDRRTQTQTKTTNWFFVPEFLSQPFEYNDMPILGDWFMSSWQSKKWLGTILSLSRLSLRPKIRVCFFVVLLSKLCLIFHVKNIFLVSWNRYLYLTKPCMWHNALNSK